jgi:hypothetical protein
LPVKWISSAPLRAILFRHHAADNWQPVLYNDPCFRERVPEENVEEFDKVPFLRLFDAQEFLRVELSGSID